MKNQIAIKLVAAYALSTWAGGLLAHENHGFSGSHWHATDVWGFVALGGMAALAIWLSRNGK